MQRVVLFYTTVVVLCFILLKEGAEKKKRNNCTGCKRWVSMECEILDTDEPLWHLILKTYSTINQQFNSSTVFNNSKKKKVDGFNADMHEFTA